MLKTLKQKRVLVIGVTGQVGRALVRQLTGKCELITAARAGAQVQLDLRSNEQIVAVLQSIKPEIVINAAAYTQVDNAEDEPDLAQQINAVAPGVIAQQCKILGSTLVHYSTDYVFSGKGSKPLTEEDPVSPINVYGKSKLDGERAIQEIDCQHLIFRTCWVYDGSSKNFVSTITNHARNKTELKVVNDQFGTPTSAACIADISYQIILQNITAKNRHSSSGNRIFHLTALGYTSWHGFAVAIIANASSYEKLAVEQIVAVDSSQFPTKAKRPNWSVLSTAKLQTEFDIELSDWEDYLCECFEAK